MVNDLDKFFVTAVIYEGQEYIKSLTVPKSLIHDVIMKFKYPGSKFDVRIIDKNGIYRINTELADKHLYIP